MVCQALPAVAGKFLLHPLLVADSPLRISGFQPSFKLSIGITGELPIVVEGAVDHEYPFRAETLATFGDTVGHQRLRHDVEGIGGEQIIKRAGGPLVRHVQCQGGLCRVGALT